jgi:glucosamine--fructose-6-phosphate aminotransferase (isomerizing)
VVTARTLTITARDSDTHSPGVPVTRVADDRLGELLSIFPLTAAVQRIALEAAETLGVNADTFGLHRPGHQGWDRLEL